MTIRPAEGARRTGAIAIGLLSFVTFEIPSIEATRALSLHPASCSATTPPCRMTRTRSQVLKSSSSPLTTRIALPSRRIVSMTCSRASFDFTSTPAVGSIRTRTEGALASARPMTTFCWLPPDRLETNCPGPCVTIPSEAIAELVFCGQPARRDESERAEPVGDGHRRVVRHRLGQDETLLVAAFRHAADAEGERRRNVARAAGADCRC